VARLNVIKKAVGNFEGHRFKVMFTDNISGEGIPVDIFISRGKVGENKWLLSLT